MEPTAQLLNHFPTSSRAQRFITVFTRVLHWSLSWARSIQPIPSQSRLSYQRIRPTSRPRVIFRNKIIVHGMSLAQRTTPTPFRLSATTYSIYSKLLFVSGGRLFHPQPEDAPCRGDKGYSCRHSLFSVWQSDPFPCSGTGSHSASDMLQRKTLNRLRSSC
jgi:hypothetical protein